MSTGCAEIERGGPRVPCGYNPDAQKSSFDIFSFKFLMKSFIPSGGEDDIVAHAALLCIIDWVGFQSSVVPDRCNDDVLVGAA
jgi:hypothetical protein